MENGLNGQYSDTKKFLEGLSKYYKITKICAAGEIQDCFPYTKINYKPINGEQKSINVSELSTASALGLSGATSLEPAAFVNAQGIPFIISIKKDCVTDSDKAMQSISSCISGIYDLNGSNKPNKFGIDEKDSKSDIVSINGGRIGSVAVINGVELLTKLFSPSSVVGAEYNCQAEVAKNYGITACRYASSSDIWGQAKFYCHEIGGDLPTPDEALKIVQGLHANSNKEHPTGESWVTKDYPADIELTSKIFDKQITRNDPFHQFSMWTKDLVPNWTYHGRRIKMLQYIKGNTSCTPTEANYRYAAFPAICVKRGSASE